MFGYYNRVSIHLATVRSQLNILLYQPLLVLLMYNVFSGTLNPTHFTSADKPFIYNWELTSH